MENLNIFLLERFINKSYFVISCHSGYVVQISGTNKARVFDIINKKDFIWYSCWKPLNTFHKFIYKSNLRSNFSINKVFTNILNLTYSI